MPTYTAAPDDLETLASLRNANAATSDLVHVVANTCTRFAILQKAGKTAHIERLIEAGAWCDAALALVAAELPGWSVRRLVYENDEWFCSLSQHPQLPMETDDTADAWHELLPLAILSALLEARQKMNSAPAVPGRAIPHLQPLSGTALCCDNFA